MAVDLSKRFRQPELMDAPDADPKLLASSLAFIRRINRFLGYTRATLTHLQSFSKTWDRARPVRILDVATGSADIPRAILTWATRRGLNVQIVAVDLHEETVQQARAAGSDPRLQVVRADATSLPYDAGSFDYVLTAMFLHHLADEQVVQVLREIDRVAARGVVVADLLRCVPAYRWIKLFTTFSNPMVKHDAVASVRQAYTRDEIVQLRDGAGLSYATYHAHFGHRFVLAGSKA